jgi:hypothetical protein
VAAPSRVTRAALAAAFGVWSTAALSAQARAPRWPPLHVLGRVNRDPNELGLTRDSAGRLYVSGVPGGLVRFAAQGGAGTRLPGQEGRPLRGGFAWLGDTLAIGGWRGWSLLRGGEQFLGCRPFIQSPTSSVTPVFAWRALAGGRTLGEYSPRIPGEIHRFLVVSRDQQVLTRLAVKPPEAERISIAMPGQRMGAWEVEPPELTEPLWSVADNDSGVVVVEQSAGSGRVRVRRVDFSGHQVAEWTVSVPLLAISPRWREADVEKAAEGVAHRGQSLHPWAIDRYHEHITFPRYHPPVSEVVLGSDGTAWLRLATEGASVTWVRVGRNGREDWVLPADFVVAYADGQGLWGARPRNGGSQIVTTAPLPAGWEPLRFPAAGEASMPPDHCW